jgi:hypothetical protein
MTLQEAYALSEERKANLAYRKRIQRIKQTILGVLAGGFAGHTAGVFKGLNDEPMTSRLFGKVGNPFTSKPALTGLAAGSLLGGLTGYGLQRLREKYYESAGFDPTLATIRVQKDPSGQISQ